LNYRAFSIFYRFQQLAKAAEEKRRRLLAAEAAVGMRYRSCDDLETPPPPPPPPISHYATIRRHVATLGDCRAGRPDQTQQQSQQLPPLPPPSSRSLSQMILTTTTGNGGGVGLLTTTTATTPTGAITAVTSATNNNNHHHHLIHQQQPPHRPSEVRLDMVGSKTTTVASVAQSPNGGDLDALSPQTVNTPRSPFAPNILSGHYQQGSTGNVLRNRTPSASAPTSATFQSAVRQAMASSGTNSGGGGGRLGSKAPVPKNLNELFGVSPSDIDKYSRVVFPVCFVCFNLMYWLIYLHISNIFEENMIDDDA